MHLSSFDDDGELRIEDSKVMALCNEVDDDDHSDSASSSRYQVLANQSPSRASGHHHRWNSNDQHLTEIETRDEDDDIDFIEEIAESISAQPSRLYCDELARKVDCASLSQQPPHDPLRDELDELLDEALKDEDDVDSQNEESEESASASRSGSSSTSDGSSSSSSSTTDVDDAESLNSSIVSDDLRLMLSESGLSASSYQVASFPTIASATNSKAKINRQPLHKKIVISQSLHAHVAHLHKDEDVTEASHRPRHYKDDDDDDEDYEYEYFPEPSVVDLLPGLNAALDAMAERLTCGACAKDTTTGTTTTSKSSSTRMADKEEESARDGPPEDASPAL